MRPVSGALAALTRAALALPAVAAAGETQTDYLFSYYHEGDIPASRSASGKNTGRYNIQTHAFRASQALEDNTLGLELNFETMSGASPWYVDPGQNKPVQVMSGASIKEERKAVQAYWSRPLGVLLGTATAGYSTENDYRSVSGGLELGYTPENNALSYTGGASYSGDTVHPTGGGDPRFTPVRITSADKHSASVYGGVSWILSPNTVVQGSVSYLNNGGFLSDPYKLAFEQDIPQLLVADHRPDTREAVAVTGRLRQYVEGADAALHVDYRYYHDNWKIDAHTLELAWHQNLPANWKITPSLRWYSQSQAFFYAPYYPTARADRFASSDYRLSPFGALSGRLNVSKTFANWMLGGGVEFYDARGSYAVGKVKVENPGLVQYTIFDLRLSARF